MIPCNLNIRVAKIVDLLFSTGTGSYRDKAFFLRGKIIVFIFLPLLLANCLTPSVTLAPATNFDHFWHTAQHYLQCHFMLLCYS